MSPNLEEARYVSPFQKYLDVDGHFVRFLKLGMKIERKISDFSMEIHKWNWKI
jgi:hypothetical protein